MGLTEGQIATRSITLTAEHVKAYAEITGDYNPLHFDEEFASNTRFGHLIVQGGPNDGPLARSCRDGYARARHGFSKPELEIYVACVYRRHHNRRGKGLESSSKQAGYAAWHHYYAADGRNGSGRRGVVLHRRP